jgi:hypothetical protein
MALYGTVQINLQVPLSNIIIHLVFQLSQLHVLYIKLYEYGPYVP